MAINTNYDVSGVLQEMRRLAAAAQGPAATAAGAAQPAAGGFASVLSQAVGQVNGLQNEASNLATRVELGDKSVSLTQAMIAANKASVAFQATVQVRNRVVQAYQDIMNMAI